MATYISKATCKVCRKPYKTAQGVYKVSNTGYMTITVPVVVSRLRREY